MLRALLCAALLGLALLPARPAAEARQADPGPAGCPAAHCVYLPDVARVLPLLVGPLFVNIGGGKFPLATVSVTLQNVSGAPACDVLLSFVVGASERLTLTALVGRVEPGAPLDVLLLTDVDPAVQVDSVQALSYRPCD